MKNKSPILIDCKNLVYSIGFQPILKKVSFQLFQKELCFLIGENGSGKSILFKTLLFYQNYPEYVKKSKKNISISYLGHQLGIYTSLSLQENLDYFQSIFHSVHLNTVSHLLEIFKLEQRKNDPIYTFSQGMKQKAALIRALMVQADLYLLDEPYTSLDKKTKEDLNFYFKKLKRKTCLFVISHDDIDENLADRKIVIKKGKIEIHSNTT